MASYSLEYTPYPTAQPSGAPPNDYEHISASPEMFGGLIAGAEEKLGGAIEKASDTGFNVLAARAALNNEVHASEKLTWAAGQFGTEWEGFKKLEGKSAAMGLPDYQTRLKGIYDDSLKDESLAVQAHLSRGLSALMDRYQGWGAGHAGSQERQWHDKVAVDQSKQAGSDAVLAAQSGTWDQVEQSLRASDDGVRKNLEQRGYGVDAESSSALDYEISKNRGNNVASIVKDLSDRGDTKSAQAVIDRYKDQVDKDSLVKMGATVKTANAQAEGIDIVKKRVGQNVLSPLDMVAIGETGRPGSERQAQIASDTAGSKSYGILGLNSRSGSAATFAKENPELGLTAVPGTADFDNQWRVAAAIKGDALAKAQQNYYDTHVVPGVRADLEGAGVSSAIASNPRVAAYMADRRVQMGTVGLQSALDAAAGSTSPEAFIAAVSQADRANVDSNFQTYLAQYPGNRQGLLNRIDRRTEMSALASGEMGGFDYASTLADVMNATEGKSPAVRQAAISWLGHLHQVQQASYLDQERAWRVQDHLRKQQADEAFDDVMAGKLSASQILADNRLHGRDREHALSLLDRDSRPQVAAAASARNTKGLYDRMNLPDNDPRKISDVRTFDDAYVSTDPATAINKADLKWLKETFRERTGENEPFAKQKAQFYKAIEPMIDKSLLNVGLDMTGSGKLRFLQFIRDTDAQIAKYRKEGKDPAELINPDRYLGDSNLLAPYMSSGQSALPGAAVEAVRTAPPGPAGKRKLLGETIEQYSRRTGVGMAPAPVPAGEAAPSVPQSR
jgi:hypothetical protein